MSNEKALSEFMAKISEAQALLGELQAHVDAHLEVSPEDVTWGTFGNAGYIVEKLSEIADWTFKRGEYAE
jgi:hypothetical protein